MNNPTTYGRVVFMSTKIHDYSFISEYKNIADQDIFICDIDGTIAEKGDRKPYDYSKVSHDTLIEPIATVVKMVDKYIAPVVFVSGRSSSCYNDTKYWLESNGFTVHGLYMRPSSDKYTEDYKVKYEIVKQFEGKVNILGVFDDRPQVIRMWEKLGIKVFNVGKIDVDF